MIDAFEDGGWPLGISGVSLAACIVALARLVGCTGLGWHTDEGNIIANRPGGLQLDKTNDCTA